MIGHTGTWVLVGRYCVDTMPVVAGTEEKSGRKWKAGA